MPLTTTTGAFSAKGYGIGIGDFGGGVNGYGFIVSWNVPTYQGGMWPYTTMWNASIPEIQIDGNGDVHYVMNVSSSSATQSGVHVKQVNGIESFQIYTWRFIASGTFESLGVNSQHLAVSNQGEWSMSTPDRTYMASSNDYPGGLWCTYVFEFPSPWYRFGISNIIAFDDSEVMWGASVPDNTSSGKPYVKRWEVVNGVISNKAYLLSFVGTFNAIIAKTNLFMFMNGNSFMSTTNTGTFIYGYSSSNYRQIGVDSSQNCYVWCNYTNGGITYLAVQKYNPSGTLLWSKKLDMTSTVGTITSVDFFCVDDDGNCYFVYDTSSFTAITAIDTNANHLFTNVFGQVIDMTTFTARGDYMVFSTVSQPYVCAVGLPIDGRIPFPGYYFYSGISFSYANIDTANPTITDVIITKSNFGGGFTFNSNCGRSDGETSGTMVSTHGERLIG